MTDLTLHVLSDIHLEFGALRCRMVAGVDCDVHILAGDIGVGLTGLEWALKTFTRPVIYVMGNHEFYGQRTVAEFWKKARAKVAGTHVHLMENEAVIIGGVRFVGASLWTDFCLNGVLRQDEMMRIIPELLTDYERIRLARRSPRWQYLTPRTARAWHEESVAFLEQALDQDPTNGDLGAAPFTRTVVVTHHPRKSS
ncbi:MAG: metallophosphoesterase [Acidiferrobacter sp.]